ncbi:ATP-binding protein [uncultured Draconibacterium sp.]|uniref:ATP-binding protein n=1 Tax=uncultured Draconibacterium sp. TaxID=1573823 RepID=UPI0025D5EBC4|nr:ATP-binding protein [uncultured Draconibacterium sp.]
MLLTRERFVNELKESIRFNPITAILGPRQCGKTTLARIIASSQQPENIFDLEDPADFELLKAAPKSLLQNARGLIIIDEIQLLPELFPLLRVLVDQENTDRKFLILGSASPDLIRKSSESLAGRIGFINLTGFRLNEVGKDKMEQLWFRGGFPRSFLAENEKQSFSWRNNFTQTFLERDISQIGFNVAPVALRRFWQMLAHYHAQIWTGAEFARSLGVSEPTVKRYLDLLTGTFMVRQLQPWHENLKKRQVKSPKVYIRDSGILHSLLSLEGDAIYTHPKLGASWEGFVIEQLIQHADTRDFFYWRTHAGAELDLLVLKNGKRIGFEVKFSDAAKTTRSVHSVIEDLKLDKLYLINRGTRKFFLTENIEVVPVNQLLSIKF